MSAGSTWAFSNPEEPMSDLETIRRLRNDVPGIGLKEAKRFVDAGLDAELVTHVRRARLEGAPGLSRRDAFAMAAMQGAIACGGLYGEHNRMIAARECVHMADALIAALDEGTP